MENCTFRITGLYPDGFIPDMRRRYGMTLMVREFNEQGENLHYHGYCQNVRLNTLRMYLKRHFKGNDQYSCRKAGSDHDALRYLCKGKKDQKPDVIYNDGHNTDLLHQLYWETNAEIQKKKRKGNILEQCWDDIKDLVGDSTDESVIGGEILEWYHVSGKRFPTVHAMNTMLNTYIYSQNYKQTQPYSKSEMFRRLYR